VSRRVGDESPQGLDAYPENVTDGKTVNILVALAQHEWRGVQKSEVEPDERWTGLIVISQTEDLGQDRWCEELEWLIREAGLAAMGDEAAAEG
jgi:hypothetical protein